MEGSDGVIVNVFFENVSKDMEEVESCVINTVE